MKITVKRVYEPANASDGYRVLIDRLWPRGIKKEALQIDEWCKDIAPSQELREWFHVDVHRFNEFAARYEAELAASDIPAQLLERAGGKTLTLLYAAKDPRHNHATVLRDSLKTLQEKLPR